MAEVVETLARFVALWSDDILLGDLAGRLTCAETEALADVLRLLGHDGAAELLLAEHARSDEDGDQHWAGEA